MSLLRTAVITSARERGTESVRGMVSHHTQSESVLTLGTGQKAWAQVPYASIRISLWASGSSESRV